MILQQLNYFTCSNISASFGFIFHCRYKPVLWVLLISDTISATRLCDQSSLSVLSPPDFLDLLRGLPPGQLEGLRGVHSNGLLGCFQLINRRVHLILCVLTNFIIFSPFVTWLSSTFVLLLLFHRRRSRLSNVSNILLVYKLYIHMVL